MADDLPFIPLHRRTIRRAMAKTVQAVMWPNDAIELRGVRVR